MWIIICFGLLIGILLLNHSKTYESMENPQDMVEVQQGEILSLHKKINSVTISEESLDVIQSDINIVSDQIFKLQENLE
jgi:hypothetical protein